MEPGPQQRETLQNLYLQMRELLQTEIVRPICVQRAFEEILGGVFQKNHWRSTHITDEAAEACIRGDHRMVQRAHGAFSDRLSRYERTIEILTGDELYFDEWFAFYSFHDRTVLMTRAEHGTGEVFDENTLLRIPANSDLFVNSGMSFKVRKKTEIPWLVEQMLLRKPLEIDV
jgi:hypothetical protein